jgi:hypothetical protein
LLSNYFQPPLLEMQNLPTPQNPEAATEEEACRQLLPVEMQNPEVAVEEERRRQ